MGSRRMALDREPLAAPRTPDRAIGAETSESPWGRRAIHRVLRHCSSASAFRGMWSHASFGLELDHDEALISQPDPAG